MCFHCTVYNRYGLVVLFVVFSFGSGPNCNDQVRNAEIEICCSKYARSSQQMVEVKKGWWLFYSSTTDLWTIVDLHRDSWQVQSCNAHKKELCYWARSCFFDRKIVRTEKWEKWWKDGNLNWYHMKLEPACRRWMTRNSYFAFSLERGWFDSESFSRKLWESPCFFWTSDITSDLVRL